MTARTTDSFYDSLPVLPDFEGVTREENFTPLPAGWFLAAADIVNSTHAIAEGRYKAVNMAGASVISAVLNAVGQHDLPFVFGGDGAMIAVPPEGEQPARAALAATRAWALGNLGLTLRVALVPVAAIRQAGHDVRVARFSASTEVTYAMFSGGGAAWAEQRMKDGTFAIPDDPNAGMPDLTGLSCRWNPVKSRHGSIVSIIVLPRPDADMEAFRDLVRNVVALASRGERSGHPLPPDGPPLNLSLKGCLSEIRTAPGGWARITKAADVAMQVFLVIMLSKFGLKAGRFDPVVYRQDVSANSDFRKYDDGLKMTVDVDRQRLDAISRSLADGEARGICLYGMHVQSSALVTCLVPTPLSRDHMHFVDGGAGGYAMAAAQIKQALKQENVNTQSTV